MLKKDCLKALNILKKVDNKKDTVIKYEIGDIKTWAYLGLFFAEKIKGAISLQSYRIEGNEKNKRRLLSIWKML